MGSARLRVATLLLLLTVFVPSTLPKKDEPDPPPVDYYYYVTPPNDMAYVSDGNDLETTTTSTVSTSTFLDMVTQSLFVSDGSEGDDVVATGVLVGSTSTRFPPPKNWVPPSTTPFHMSSVETVPLPEQTVYGVVSCVSIAVLIVMLYMALFGQRMRHTAIRWHVINCSFWGILHLISYSSFAEKAPWPGFITNEDWKATSRQVECFTRSVFPAGMFFIYIEAMLLTCAPRLSEKSIFNFIFFLLLVPVLNGIMIFCYLAHYMNVKWFYEPIDTFNLFTYLLFCIMTFVYFIWCLIGSCMCCASLAHRDGVGPRSMATFSDMWMLMPYGMLPTFMYGPSFGMTSVGFAMKHLTKWANDHGLMGGGGGGDGDGDGGEGGGGGIMGMIDMSMMIELTTNALLAMPWFVLLFPLVQSVLTLVCIRIFREQFFFTISCGRVYEGPRGKIGEQKPSEWPSSATVGPPPMYPTTPKEVA